MWHQTTEGSCTRSESRPCAPRTVHRRKNVLSQTEGAFTARCTPVHGPVVRPSASSVSRPRSPRRVSSPPVRSRAIFVSACRPNYSSVLMQRRRPRRKRGESITNKRHALKSDVYWRRIAPFLQEEEGSERPGRQTPLSSLALDASPPA